MNLPDYLPMIPTTFGDGRGGYAIQIRRNEEYGVQESAIRKKHGAPWITTFSSDFLPDKEFNSYSELILAVGAIDKVTPFTAIILGIEKKNARSSGKCYLCRGEWIHTVIVKTSWRYADQHHIPSCMACLEKVKANPRAAIEARQKFVREKSIP